MQHGRVIRWPRRRYSGSIMHFQYMPDGSDRQTDTSPMLTVFHYESGQRINFFSSPRMT